MTEHKIVAKAEKQVKEWIDYAKQEYGWEDKLFELFEEPMIEVATAVAIKTIKDLQKEIEQDIKKDAEKYSHSKCVSSHIKYISRDSDVVRKIHNLVKLTYIQGAEKIKEKVR